jgi:hypothetical protein
MVVVQTWQQASPPRIDDKIASPRRKSGSDVGNHSSLNSQVGEAIGGIQARIFNQGVDMDLPFYARAAN